MIPRLVVKYARETLQDNHECMYEIIVAASHVCSADRVRNLTQAIEFEVRRSIHERDTREVGRPPCAAVKYGSLVAVDGEIARRSEQRETSSVKGRVTHELKAQSRRCRGERSSELEEQSVCSHESSCTAAR